MTDLPLYQSHKKVWAAKIERIDIRVPEEFADLLLNGGFEVSVTDTWLGRHTPPGRTLKDLIGGYFVRYDGGYESWSPAEAFEVGYTLVRPVTDLQDALDTSGDKTVVVKPDGSVSVE